jgi:hypothetical protein
LEQKVEFFAKLKTKIIIVSFGEYSGALRWSDEVKMKNYLMITDEKRVLYQIFDLKRSFSKVWNTETLIYYAEQLRKNIDLPQAYRDINDDPHQMGGNFIIKASNFRLLFAYRSKTPPDRPSPDMLIKLLKDFEKNQE